MIPACLNTGCATFLSGYCNNLIALFVYFAKEARYIRNELDGLITLMEFYSEIFKRWGGR